MNFLKKILNKKDKNLSAYIKKQAIIVDVRTKQEWENGHITNSLHIPLNKISEKINDIKTLNKPVIACCASGIRSHKASKILKSHNIDAINGGGWSQLNHFINKSSIS